MSSAFNVGICCFGIYGAYLASGLVQEGIYMTGDKLVGDTFKYPIFLVFAMSLGSALSSYAALVWSSDFDLVKPFALFTAHRKDATQREKEKSKSFNWDVALDFFLISLTYIGAMLCSNYALTQVNYPTQVLVKSAKMVPVVLGGWLIYRKIYPWYDYAGVIIITTSLVIFNMAKMKTKAEAAQTTLGVALCFGSLLCDGLTGPRQDKLNKHYKIQAMEHMLFTNLFAVFPSALAMLVFEWNKPFAYCVRYPEVVNYVIMFCVCNTIGQIFIFKSLTAFGALYLALITTTRKFFTVLMSVLYYGHSLNFIQWGAVSAVFGSLIMQSVFSRLEKQRLQKLEKKLNADDNKNPMAATSSSKHQ